MSAPFNYARCPECHGRAGLSVLCATCNPDYVPVDLPVELQRLRRVRDAAIAHLMQGDTTGAMAALCLQRDNPEFFDKVIWASDPVGDLPE